MILELFWSNQFGFVRMTHHTIPHTIFIILLPRTKRHFLIVNFPFILLNPKRHIFIDLRLSPPFAYYHIKVRTNTIYIHSCSRTVNLWIIMHHKIQRAIISFVPFIPISARQKVIETLPCGAGLILHRPKRISSIPFTFSLSQVLVVLGPTSQFSIYIYMYVVTLDGLEF